MKPIIVLLLSLIIPAQAQADFTESLGRAGQAFHSANYSEALILLRQAEPLAETTHDQATVGNAIGWTYYNLGDIQRAREYLQRAFEQAQTTGDDKLVKKISNNLGLLEYAEGNPQVAKSYFSNQWAVSSDTANTYLANIQRQERLSQAKQHINSGISYRRQGDFENAIKEYDKALEIVPDSARVQEFKGYAQYRIGDHAGSIETLENALRIEPDRLNVVINLFKSYCVSNDTEAIDALKLRSRELLSQNRNVLRRDGELNRVCKNFDIHSEET
ncbi:tetratricopeptide repeat protein [Motiliproteus sp.]|uniref:tetratricopeptide repeat protein n=1 Tax=Motiliproteus sp. TaxID=1898955 RepID=UPI003BA932BB